MPLLVIAGVVELAKLVPVGVKLVIAGVVTAGVVTLGLVVEAGVTPLPPEIALNI